MARRLLCRECGKPKTTPPEDLARGLDCRHVRGILTCSVVCDQCGRELPKGSEAVAFTQPSNRIGRWEGEYMLTNGRIVRTVKGVFVIEDKGQVTISVSVKRSLPLEIQEVIIDQIRRRHKKQMSEELKGREFVCEIDRSTHDPELRWRWFIFAQPGSYQFVEYESPIRPHEFEGGGLTCEECGLSPAEEVHI